MNFGLIVILFLLVSTLYRLGLRIFAKKYPDTAHLSMALTITLSTIPLSFVYAIYYGGFTLNLPVIIWLQMIIAGALFALGNVAIFKANELIDAAQTAVLGNFQTVFVVMLSAIFLSERLSHVQLIGMAVLLVSATIVSVDKFTKRSLQFDHNSWYVVAGSAYFASAQIIENHLLYNMSVATYLVVVWVFIVLFLFIFGYKKIRIQSKVLSKRYLVESFLLGIPLAGLGVTFVLGIIATGSTSLMMGAMSYRAVTMFVLAWILLKERQKTLQKLIGSALATVGLYLVLVM